MERRTLEATTFLREYLRAEGWPDLEQVFRLERQRTASGETTTEVVYGITSLPRSAASAKKLLDYVRGHWGIENALHRVRDVTLGEDACRVRRGGAAQILAVLRNVVIHLTRYRRRRSVAAQQRHYAAHPKAAIELLQTVR